MKKDPWTIREEAWLSRRIHQALRQTERRGETLLEHLAGTLVRLAGARFQGIQYGNYGVPTLVLFTADTIKGSTLAVPLHELSTERIRAKIAETQARWEQK